MGGSLRGLIVGVWVAVAAGPASAEFSPELQSLIAAAQKEGELHLTFGEGSAGGEAGAARFEKGMNEMFGAKIKMVFTPGPSMPAMGSQIMMLNAAKQPSPTDVYVGWSRHYPPLYKRKALQTFEWTKLLPGRITPEMVELDGMAVKFATSIPGVYYNTKLSPYKPERLSDFLKPEWKGRIASTPYAANFDVLGGAGFWGPEKTVDFAKSLSAQIAGLIRCNETERLASGEFLALVINCSGRDIEELARKGAPVANVTPKDFMARNYTYFGVPKNAQHPNAGALYIAFVMTPEGQKIMWETWGADLDLFPDSNMHKDVAEIEKQNGGRMGTADATWQLANDAGNNAWAEANKILLKK